MKNKPSIPLGRQVDGKMKSLGDIIEIDQSYQSMGVLIVSSNKELSDKIIKEKYLDNLSIRENGYSLLSSDGDTCSESAKLEQIGSCMAISLESKGINHNVSQQHFTFILDGFDISSEGFEKIFSISRACEGAKFPLVVTVKPKDLEKIQNTQWFHNLGVILFANPKEDLDAARKMNFADQESIFFLANSKEDGTHVLAIFKGDINHKIINTKASNFIGLLKKLSKKIVR